MLFYGVCLQLLVKVSLSLTGCTETVDNVLWVRG
jgi:hypothetical protein